MKIEGVDLVRCKSCNVTLTVDDVTGHERRHRHPIAVEPIGRWIPWFLRPGGMKPPSNMRPRVKVPG